MHPEDTGETKPTSLSDQVSTTKNQIPSPGNKNPPIGKQKPKLNRSSKRSKVILGILLAAVFVIVATVVIGGLVGYMSGRQTHNTWNSAQLESVVHEQYQLGIQDLEEGNYEIARQRLEYVITQDPTYPGAADRMAEILYILYATATPSIQAPTSSPESTKDPRPAQDLFARAQGLLGNRNWTSTIDTLVSLRKENPSYNTVRVDGMLYVALRYRGVEKILQVHNLEGGIYDLALAEKFAPLDVEANNIRNWARIYLIGSSFWGAYPEQAVYYFGQIASTAPYLRDASGWTAVDRYHGALIQYGDHLAKEEEWCQAQTQYETAYSIRADSDLLKKIEDAALKCSPPTEAVSSETPTPTITGSVTVSPTVTGTMYPTQITPTATPGFPTSTGIPATPTATIPAPTSQPSDTPEPTATPEPSDTPAPTDTPPPESTDTGDSSP